MKLRLVFGLGILAIANGLNAIAASPSPLREQMISPEHVLSRAAELGLAPGQRAALQQVAAEQQDRMKPLLQRLQQESAALRQLLQSESPEENAVMQQFDRLNAVESEVKRVRLQFSLRARAQLTPDQLRRALALRATTTPPTTETRPGTLQAKLRRLKEGVERWKQEGRDTTELQELWDKFQEAESGGFYGEARRNLDAAIDLLDTPSATAPR